MNKELISIIIPVYNSEKYLKPCVDSVINQTYSNLEIILIDDGSKDSSGKICDEYANVDKRIRVIHKENTGVSASRNVGITESNGSLIMFIDSDDYIEKNMVQCLYNKMIEKDVDVVRCKANMINIQGIVREEELFELSNEIIRKEDVKKIIPHLLLQYENIACYSVLLLIKKDCIVSFDTTLKYMEDAVFFIKLLQSIESIFFYDKPFYWYRYNEESATKKPENGIKNVYNLLDSAECIKQNIKTFQNEKLIKKMNANFFNMIMSKTKLYIGCVNYKNAKNELVALMHNNVFLQMLDYIDFDQMTITKKIQRKLIQKKYVFILYYLVKITTLKKDD